MGVVTHAGEARHPRVDWLRFAISFLAHQALASWGVIVVTPWILFNLVDVGHLLGWHVPTPRIQWLLYGTPYFPAYVLVALALGWLLSGILRHPVMLWVWALPLIPLCVGVARYPHTPTLSNVTVFAVLGTYPWQRSAAVHTGSVGALAALSHFFGWGHGVQPYDQVLVVVPFYTSVAYSVGALLARPATHRSAFFESLRHVRIWRLALAVGLPWFLIRGIQVWEQAAGRSPLLRTAIGFQALLGILLIASSSVVLLFAVAIALLGPRFAITRFFISGRSEHS